MKLDVSVKNLGQIKEATFNIRPMTVITGPNGTGKSFFTKSLYSIFNVVNRNVYQEVINQTIREIQLKLKAVAVSLPSEHIESEHEIESLLLQLVAEFDVASNWKINDYFVFVSSKSQAVATIKKQYKAYLETLKNSNQFELINDILVAIDKDFNYLLMVLINNQNFYIDFLSKQITNELLENFQISTLGELIKFGEKKIEIKADNLISIDINNAEKLSMDVGTAFIDDVAKLSSVVFFESPAYWKVRSALKSAKIDTRFVRQIFGKRSDDVLTGVPKYFYDLDDALTIRTKTEGVFKSATDILEKELGGEFIFQGDTLSFKDKSGREISKHLVSFGMTNLGMIQALLKHNIITEGSFIFIDEPETNLHPDWQVKLAEVLLVLAQGGVNIVITTHSSDFVKALEVKIKKLLKTLAIEIMEDFLSVHYVDVDGKLLEFKSSDQLEQLIEARSLLNRAYEELYFSDL